MRLLEAEALQSRGDSDAALALLQAVGERLREGHEIGVRIRWHSQLLYRWRADTQAGAPGVTFL